MGETAWQKKAAGILEACAAGGATITYAALAGRAAIPPPHRIHKLTAWLESLMEEDAAKGVPMRAAVVVSRVDGRPGRGYYEKLAALDSAGENHAGQNSAGQESATANPPSLDPDDKA